MLNCNFVYSFGTLFDTGSSCAFLVKKNGGSDDGKLYALKATKIPVKPNIKSIRLSFSYVLLQTIIVIKIFVFFLSVMKSFPQLVWITFRHLLSISTTLVTQYLINLFGTSTEPIHQNVYQDIMIVSIWSARYSNTIILLSQLLQSRSQWIICQFCYYFLIFFEKYLLIVFDCSFFVQILESVSDFPFAAGLNYAFREGKWLFLVLGKC